MWDLILWCEGNKGVVDCGLQVGFLALWNCSLHTIFLSQWLEFAKVLRVTSTGLSFLEWYTGFEAFWSIVSMWVCLDWVGLAT